MVINQFHAIGDILFIEPICRYFWKKNGEKPILPVRDHLIGLSQYIESAKFVPMSQFVLDYDSMAIENPDYLPLRFANQIIRALAADDHSDFENMMPDKYLLANIDPELWTTLDINFKLCKGIELYEKLGLKKGDKYVVVNENCQAGKVNILPCRERTIYMENIPGYSVIDWFYVILNATENHHVSTSTFFLMQAIHNKYDFKSKVFLYPRPNADGLRGISKLKPSYNYRLCG